MKEITRINRQKFVNKIFRMLEDTGMSHTDARHYMAHETGIKIGGVSKWANGRVVPRQPALGKLQSLSRALIRESKGRRSLHPIVNLEKVHVDPNGKVPVFVPVSEDHHELNTNLQALHQLSKTVLSESDRMALANLLMMEFMPRAD